MPELRASVGAAHLAGAGRAVPPPLLSPRARAMEEFLAASGWAGAAPAPLAADASFRRYYRLRRGGDSAVVMDAPPPQEDVGPYVAVAAILRGLGLSAPAIFAEDRARGFLLIEDFGDDTYTRLLARGADEPALYALAIDVLIALQRAQPALELPGLPPYDEARAAGARRRCWSTGICRRARRAADAAAVREEYLALWRARAAARRRPSGRRWCCATIMSTI